MRAVAFVLTWAPFLAASALAQSPEQPLERTLKDALAEEAAANVQTAKLEKAASSARTEADRLQTQEAAALQAINAAEARISAADVQLRLASAYVAAHRQQLAAEQQPVSSLLAGLATMARRPPLLALADSGGTDELVKVRLLLDSTVPIIRKRTDHVSAELNEGRRLEKAARIARSQLASSRDELLARRRQFALLEQRAIGQALASSGQALGTSDVAIAASENVERLRAQDAASQSIRRVAEALVHDDTAPPSPFRPEGSDLSVPFAYELPASAAVTQGLGAINESGVISRGITLATQKGAVITAPANGTIRFAGPYRDYDGVIIIDHGSGWLTLIVNAASSLRSGDKVGLGEPIGRALGPLQVELSQNDHRISPALIAGSSQKLSKGGKGG